MTAKMYRCMKYIETTLGIEYDGETMIDAFDFVAKYKKLSEGASHLSELTKNCSKEEKRAIVDILSRGWAL